MFLNNALLANYPHATRKSQMAIVWTIVTLLQANTKMTFSHDDDQVGEKNQKFS